MHKGDFLERESVGRVRGKGESNERGKGGRRVMKE
jgi:hypothetical protein